VTTAAPPEGEVVADEWYRSAVAPFPRPRAGRRPTPEEFAGGAWRCSISCFKGTACRCPRSEVRFAGARRSVSRLAHRDTDADERRHVDGAGAVGGVTGVADAFLRARPPRLGPVRRRPRRSWPRRSATTRASSSVCSRSCGSSTPGALSLTEPRRVRERRRNRFLTVRARDELFAQLLSAGEAGCTEVLRHAGKLTLMDSKNRFITPPRRGCSPRRTRRPARRAGRAAVRPPRGNVVAADSRRRSCSSDVIGYLPGAWRNRRRGAGRIAPLYHHCYNLTTAT